MKQLLLTLHQQDIQPDAAKIETSKFRTREAARAVLLDANDAVYLMNVTVHGYHKLPGGGIDDGEVVQQALQRELMEEVGCMAEVIIELGTIVEYRDYEELRQTSYCFLARQTGEQVASSLEQGEIDEGMVELKAKSIGEAIKLLEADTPNNLEGKFIQQRDLSFLKEAAVMYENLTQEQV